MDFYEVNEMLTVKLSTEEKGLARNTNKDESERLGFLAAKFVEMIVKPFNPETYPQIALKQDDAGDLHITMHQRHVQSRFTHAFAGGTNIYGVDSSLVGVITFYLNAPFPSDDAPVAILSLIFNNAGKVTLGRVPVRGYDLDMGMIENDMATRFVMDHLLHEVQARLEKIEPE